MAGKLPRILVLALLMAGVCAVAHADTRLYRYSLTVRSGDSIYVSELSRNETQTGRWSEVERDKAGRMHRVSTFLDGNRVATVYYHYEGNTTAPSGYDYFSATGEQTARVSITRNANNDRVRQDYYSAEGKFLEFSKRTYDGNSVEQIGYTAEGKPTSKYIYYFSSSGVVTRQRWIPSEENVHYDSELDERTGMSLSRKKYKNDQVESSDTYKYVNGILVENNIFDGQGRQYGTRTYQNGLKVRERYDFASGDTEESRLAYNAKRQAIRTEFERNGRLICVFTYERLPNGRVVRTLAHSPQGQLMAEYPDYFVDKVQKNGDAVDRAGQTILHQTGNWW